MFREYAPLRRLPLPPKVAIAVTPVAPAPRVTLDSPALAVMTDFAKTPAAVIEPEAGIEFANDYMKRRGVRALVVIDAAEIVAGVLTATDLLGEKPVQLALSRGVTRAELRVADIMTPRALLEWVALEELEHARVGHVVATLRQAGRQHLLVGERAGASERVRGIISLSQIARQLGVNLQPNTFARTFAEIEAALGH